MHELVTSAMASLVAMTSMSAQETRFRHRGTASTAALALITVSKPSPASDRLAVLSFSAVLLAVDAISTDASHPYMHPNSWKKRCTVAPTVMKVCWNFLATAPRTMASTSGHTPA
ncbi:hypothetical protein CFC21_016988 [Triticum aestivum]|uniref:Uncharacterized protein n=3 Tax=Triticum TaxID=4564 RepID=A0A9R1NU66_TRITD|nr:hypothetical protein CFC21_016988 [Triticum aestivum]VAH31046.1 unnamed protein product [Triticum turgidum subsp. durum]